MTDKRTIQLVVIVLGMVTLAGIFLAGVLAYQSKPIPDAVIALASTALGAVAGLLAKTSSEPAPPPPGPATGGESPPPAP